MISDLPLMHAPKQFILFTALTLCDMILSPTGRITIAFTSNNATDRQALLELKAHITNDPLGALSSWNDTVPLCQWYGVTCGRRHERVINLTLANQKLQGALSPSIGNLTFLRFLDLRKNLFYGQIPSQVGRLRHLLVLNLYSNSFQGEIPPNITCCQELKVIRMDYNELEGRIPPSISTMPKLVSLYLARNHLTGNIPTTVCNFSANFYNLSLYLNNLHGNIPSCLGRLPKLHVLQLSENNLSGQIPSPLFNLSSLTDLQIATNKLHGSLPFNIFLTLPNLQTLLLGINKFSGLIPSSLPNASRLTILDINKNTFTGSVPKKLGSLQNLLVLALAQNQLGSNGEDDDLGFLPSLANCTHLTFLAIADNHLSGVLPKSISNLSMHLESLFLQGNRMYGSLPSGIGNLVSLRILALNNNSFSGSIPPSVGLLQNLEGLDLSTNKFDGNIPLSLGNLTKLVYLSLTRNNLRGKIPVSLESCQNLQTIDLSHNHLTGAIPRELLNIPSVLTLQLASNMFSGTVSPEIGNMKNILLLAFSGNRLHGEIPTELGSCQKLEYLYMQGNMFKGTLPQSLANIQGIRVLNLGHNNLTGHIPSFMEKLRFLEYLDFSFNDFEGQVPVNGVFSNVSLISIRGNKKLCSGIWELNLPSCQNKGDSRERKVSHLLPIAIPVTVATFVTLVISFSLYFLWHRKKMDGQSNLVRSKRSIESLLPMISYSELYRATDGFSSANRIGSGTFGDVYKCTQPIVEDELVAVKVLNLSHKGAYKSFDAECAALRSIRHRNLLKIITACSSMDFIGQEFKALVLQYMPNGSLDKWLHPVEEDHQRKLALVQKLNIAIDVGCALDYLHNHCIEIVVHRDLKPSNVLLDADMVAHVGDFGISRFLHDDAQKASSTIGIKGSVGYVAPEYGIGGEASAEGDVFSYGILLLEMLTGKKPTDEMFKDQLNIHQYAKNLLGEQNIKNGDDCLRYEVGQTDENINCNAEVFLLEIGISCSMPSPKERKKMKDVLTELHALRNR